MEHNSQRRCYYQRNDGHQLNQNIHGRSGGILERIAYGIARYRSFMRIGSFIIGLAIEEKIKGIMPPTKRLANTSALYISIPRMPTTPTKAANKARAVNAAEAMAKPFPVAAVVLPTASRVSVFSLTSFGNSLISA